MPFGIQPLHIVIVVIVALIIFGPSRLPEIGRGLGRALNEFRKGTREMTEGFREEVTKPASEQVTQSANAESSLASPSQPQPQPQATAGNFCTQCGAPNPSGSHFCNKCGAQLPA
jgi:sec-independent protein translocase protein TatA